MHVQRFPIGWLELESAKYLEEGARAWQRLSAHISETTVNVNVDLRHDSTCSGWGAVQWHAAKL